MKYLILLFLFIATPVWALDKCMTGSWYDPENSGSGVDIQVLDSSVTAKYYAYGSSGQAWYVMNGKEEDGSLSMVATVKQGGVITEDEVGSARIEQIDNNTITFTFDISLDADDGFKWCLSGFCEGDFIYQRLTQPIACQ